MRAPIYEKREIRQPVGLPGVNINAPTAAFGATADPTPLLNGLTSFGSAWQEAAELKMKTTQANAQSEITQAMDNDLNEAMNGGLNPGLPGMPGVLPGTHPGTNGSQGGQGEGARDFMLDYGRRMNQRVDAVCKRYGISGAQRSKLLAGLRDKQAEVTAKIRKWQTDYAKKDMIASSESAISSSIATLNGIDPAKNPDRASAGLRDISAFAYSSAVYAGKTPAEIEKYLNDTQVGACLRLSKQALADGRFEVASEWLKQADKLGVKDAKLEEGIRGQKLEIFKEKSRKIGQQYFDRYGMNRSAAIKNMESHIKNGRMVNIAIKAYDEAAKESEKMIKDQEKRAAAAAEAVNKRFIAGVYAKYGDLTNEASYSQAYGELSKHFEADPKAWQAAIGALRTRREQQLYASNVQNAEKNKALVAEARKNGTLLTPEQEAALDSDSSKAYSVDKVAWLSKTSAELLNMSEQEAAKRMLDLMNAYPHMEAELSAVYQRRLGYGKTEQQKKAATEVSRLVDERYKDPSSNGMTREQILKQLKGKYGNQPDVAAFAVSYATEYMDSRDTLNLKGGERLTPRDAASEAQQRIEAGEMIPDAVLVCMDKSSPAYARAVAHNKEVQQRQLNDTASQWIDKNLGEQVEEGTEDGKTVKKVTRPFALDTYEGRDNALSFIYAELAKQNPKLYEAVKDQVTQEFESHRRKAEHAKEVITGEFYSSARLLPRKEFMEHYSEVYKDQPMVISDLPKLYNTFKDYFKEKTSRNNVWETLMYSDETFDDGSGNGTRVRFRDLNKDWQAIYVQMKLNEAAGVRESPAEIASRSVRKANELLQSKSFLKFKTNLDAKVDKGEILPSDADAARSVATAIERDMAGSAATAYDTILKLYNDGFAIFDGGAKDMLHTVLASPAKDGSIMGRAVSYLDHEPETITKENLSVLSQAIFKNVVAEFVKSGGLKREDWQTALAVQIVHGWGAAIEELSMSTEEYSKHPYDVQKAVGAIQTQLYKDAETYQLYGYRLRGIPQLEVTGSQVREEN